MLSFCVSYLPQQKLVLLAASAGTGIVSANLRGCAANGMRRLLLFVEAPGGAPQSGVCPTEGACTSQSAVASTMFSVK